MKWPAGPCKYVFIYMWVSMKMLVICICEDVFFILMVMQRGGCTVMVAMSDVILHSNAAQLYCTVMLHSYTAQLYCTEMLHSYTAQLYCTVMLQSNGCYVGSSNTSLRYCLHLFSWPALSILLYMYIIWVDQILLNEMLRFAAYIPLAHFGHGTYVLVVQQYCHTHNIYIYDDQRFQRQRGLQTRPLISSKYCWTPASKVSQKIINQRSKAIDY